MTRVKGGTVSKTRRRKVLKRAKGYFGSKHRLYKTAQEQLFHSGAYAYRDRKQNKRNFRKLWIIRINAACRLENISYSKFMNGLAKAGIEINRKMISEMAIAEEKEFKKLVELAKKGLKGEVIKEAKAEIIKEVETEVKLEVDKKAKKAAVKKEEKPVKKEVTKKAAPKTAVKKETTKKVAPKTTVKKAPTKKTSK